MYEFFYGRESFNSKLFMVINHAASPLLDAAMPVITILGGSRLVYCYLVILGAAFLFDRRLMPGRYLPVYAVAVLLSIGAGDLLKDFFHTPRPPVALGADQVRLLGHVSKSFSFPSGHAVFSFTTAFVLGYGRTWRWKAPLFICALLVAWSRVYVGVHYPLDVVGGAVVGIACGWAVWKCYESGDRFFRARRPFTPPPHS